MFFKAITQGCLILTTSKWLYIYIPTVPYCKWFCKEHFHIHFPILDYFFFTPDMLHAPMYLFLPLPEFPQHGATVSASPSSTVMPLCPSLAGCATGLWGSSLYHPNKDRIKQGRKALTHTSSSETSYPIMLAGTRKGHQPTHDPDNLACRS